ncbi:hypothetical protein [Desulforhopalus singaporensis]|uniref:Uncharacterized protein n=1 Tax=Desulforhopalus singaporensis TaxID=91360 RepID=A0A1H0QMF4_9BACT|nr:hypothetical protein [Desulforhopalus singaporensis]SDP18517.1 hypothetical protein SAMN05660330_02035 [Desulforhopalus singaporensis]
MINTSPPSTHPAAGTCFHRNILSVILFCCLVAAPGAKAQAANGVSAGFISSDDKNIVLSIRISHPSPATLIVEQYLSPGNAIVRTSPPAKKINRRNGVVKWLFTNVKTGTLNLVTTLDRPLSGTIKASIRFRDPRTGKYTEFQVHP